MLVTPTNLAGLQNIPISADYDHSNDDFAVWFVPFLPHNRCRELLFIPSIVGIACSVELCLERLEETEVGSVAVLTPSLATTGNSTYVLATAVRSR